MNKKNSGAILIWLLLTISLILTSLSFLYYSNKQTQIYQQLQSLADSAALAGAHQLCPSSTCQNKALRAIIRTLDHNFANLPSGYQQIQVLNQTETDEGYQLDTKNNDLTINVRFGWSKPIPGSDGQFFKNPPDADFELIYFDGPNGSWQDNNPGIPANLVINAIQVEMIIDNISGLFSTEIALVQNGSITLESFARNGPIEKRLIAPFAIPACALVNEKLNFNQEEVCYGDRILTRADRYLPEVKEFHPFSVSPAEASLGIGFKETWEDVDDYVEYYDYQNIIEANNKRQELFDNNQFGIRPSFFYSPCREDLNECYVDKHLNFNSEMLKDAGDNRYTTFGGWTNYAYSNLSDHYGVVGYTSSTDTTAQHAKLHEYMRSNLPLSTYIGETFLIYYKGLAFSHWARGIKREILYQKTDAQDINYDLGKLDAQQQGEIHLSLDRLSGLVNLPNFPNLKLAPDRPLSFTPLGKRNVKTPSTLNNLFFNPARQENPDKLSPLITEANYPTFLRDQFTNGLCPSVRMKLDFEQAEEVANQTDYSELNYTEKELLERYIGKYDNRTFRVLENGIPSNSQRDVYQTKVPIIADVRSTAKSCVNPTTKSKPAIDMEGNYQVIGYVDLNIFDVSYENGWSNEYSIEVSDRDPHTGPLRSELNSPEDNYYDYLNTYHEVSNPEDPSQTIKMPHLENNQKIAPGRFQIRKTLADGSVEYAPQVCQFARARVACGTNFISSSQNTGPRQAILFAPPKVNPQQDK